MKSAMEMIAGAGLNPTAIHYDQLRELFLPSIEWLHHVSHHTHGQNPATFSVDLTNGTQRLAFELVSDPYIKGIIEGRLSSCNHSAVDSKNQQPVFATAPGATDLDPKIIISIQR
jgi:hypothetical protein